jgi:hypothetical protein
MRIQKILGIYLVALGLAVLLNMQFPSQIASFVDYFFPMKIDLTSQGFIRYRMVLFLAATIVFLVLIPIIWNFGIQGTEPEKIKRMHWRYFVLVVFMIPISWIFFPLISLCTTCWTTNDIFYFLLTVSVFIGLQISFQALALKINLIKADN